MTLSVAIAGASGYAGGELLRLLAEHPDLEVQTVTAFGNAGQELVSVHPHLRSYSGLVLKETTGETLAGHDVVFLALPHGKSGQLAETLSADTIVVDCGADHRLSSSADWDAFYGGHYYGAWTYGLPELVLADGSRQRSRLAGAKRIAVPGCNVTAMTLGVAPGIAAGVVSAQDVVAVLAVGASGAGKKATTELLASELHGSARAYAVGGIHRHSPEVRQNLRAAGGTDVSLSFTPILVPMSRGILATTTAKLSPGIGAAAVRAAWSEAYADEPFVQLLPEGRFPNSGDTLGANTALIGVTVDEAAGRVIAVSAIDNLTKGTAGAAVQCLNIALGFDETQGLSVNGVAP